MLVHLDTETRSAVDLRASNVYRYSEDDSFAVLMCAYAIDNGPTQIAVGHDEIAALYVPGARYVAHNAGFDRVVLGRLVPAWLDPEQWDDPAARAAEYGLPRALDRLAKALGCTPKDSAGTRLIHLFSKPRKKDGGFNGPDTHPAEWQQFLDYCVQDVDSMKEVDARLPGWPSATERRAWVLDQRINDRGLRVDLDLARVAEAAGRINAERDRAEFTRITGVENPGSHPQVMAWAEAVGLALPNLKAKTVTAILENSELTPVQRRALELRQELSLASTAKYTAALNGVCADLRVRGAFRFFGAHTGRWSGSGVQLQNLPRAKFKSDEEVEQALESLHLIGAASPVTLKKLIRPMLLGPFTVIDFAAIEARVLAWLAGEDWVLDAFAGGRDIYVETAERMSTPERPMTRQDGKTAVLALGYQGGVPALRVMGAEGTDEELQVLVDAWRAANPKIVRFWRQLQDAFAEGGKAGRIGVVRDGGGMKFRLPSGRAICYYGVRFDTFTVPDADPIKAAEGVTHTRRSWRFTDPGGVGRKGIYGGLAAENVTQAVARDLLTEAMIRLDEAGYRLVGHVHDEVIVEGIHDVEELSALITTPPAWADGLPLGAAGFTTYRYKKD